MAQILDPLPSNSFNRILCCYVNATSQIQIARISNIPNWYFERVVFPGQRLVFEAISQSVLEIHTGKVASAILSDNIPCERLQIDQDPRVSEDETTPNSTVILPQQVTPSLKRRVAQPLATPVLSSVD